MATPFRALSIKSKTALVTTASVLLFFTAFAAYEIHRVRADMQTVLGAQQLTLISSIAAELDDKVLATHRALIVTAEATSPELAANPTSLERGLVEQPGYRSLFDDVFVIGRDGRVLIDLPPRNRRGISVADRDYFFRTVESRKPVISAPYMGRGPVLEAAVMMTAPILNRQGEVVAMLAGNLHPLRTNFLGKLREARVGVTGQFALFATDRTIIVSRDTDRILTKGPPPGTSPSFDHAVAGREGWEESTNSRGLRALFSYKPLNSVPWILVAALPVEEAYEPLAAAQAQAIFIAALVALLLAPLMWFSMNRVLAPIGVLRDTIRSIRSNPDSDTLVQIAHHNELGDLAEDFNALTRERRAASTALLASEERYRALTEMSSDWYWELDEDLRFSSFAGRLPGIEGSARFSTAIGRYPWELPAPGMTGQSWGAHRQTLEAHRSFRDFEVCRQGTDGTLFYAAVSGEPVFGTDGRFLGYRGVGRDITATRIAEAEAEHRRKLESLMLLISSRFLNAGKSEVDDIILDTLAKIGALVDADRCFINLLDDQPERYSISHEWCAAGIESKRGVRQHVPVDQVGPLWQGLARNEPTFVAISDLPHDSALRAMLEASGIKSSFGVPVICGGQLAGCLAFDAVREERRWPENIVVLMRLAADILGGVITQRRAAEALRASEEKFARAFRLSPMFLSITTADEGRFIDANDTSLRVMGYTREEIIGRTAADIALWKSPSDRERAIDELVRCGRITCLETELRKKSGDAIVCEVWGEPIEIGGRKCIIWITSEITARKKAEAEIRQLNETLERRVQTRTAELETLVQDLAAFSYSISHDLRAPLRAISSFSRLLSESLTGKLETEERRYLERIVLNSAKMGELIEDVLAYSQAARSEISRKAVDIDALVREIVGELRDLYPAAEIVIGQLGRVDADPTMIRQIFQNLISNALKYSSGTAQPRVELSARNKGDRTEYVVQDNGVGFDMRYADRLFGLFSRLHKDSEFEGTGAGLAIVKRLVERHSGNISATAAPGQGASFRFTI
jgi:PAS domain S-box-containing protein